MRFKTSKNGEKKLLNTSSFNVCLHATFKIAIFFYEKKFLHDNFLFSNLFAYILLNSKSSSQIK